MTDAPTPAPPNPAPPAQASNGSQTGGRGGRVVIKKYANRRLYNTATSAYVTLDDLAELVKQGVDFVVYDAKTNDDITRSVLTQIIFEQEARGENLLPIDFLRRLIGFYGESMQALLPTYLDMSLQSFAEQQGRMQQQMADVASGKPAHTIFEEQARQNMALFERAMKMFTSPLTMGRGASGEPKAARDKPSRAAPAPASPPAAAPVEAATQQTLDLMRRQMEAMQAQLDTLSRPPVKPRE